MRPPSPFLLVALLALAPNAVQGRDAPNPEGRAMRDPDGRLLSAGFAARTESPSAAQATTVVVPLPAGAVAIDSVWYDLQDMGSLGTRLVCTADGKVHTTYQKDFCELAAGGCPPNLSLPQPYPQRGMAYTYRDGSGSWVHAGKVADPRVRNCCLTELFGGFGTIALTTSGRAAISQHMNEDGCDLRGNFYLEDAVAGTTWTDYLTPIVDPSYLFPQIAATPGGSFVVLGEVPRGGEYDEVNDFRVSYLAAPGQRFTCPTGWQCGAWTAVAPASLYRDGRPAFPCIASSSNGRVGIAVGDFGGNVFLMESSNGTFSPGTVTIRNLTNYIDATITKTDSTSTQYRSWIHCHLAYNDTTPNVVWSELQARKSGSAIAYFDYHSRIMHWSSTHGLSVVKQVQAGEADRYDDVDNGLAGPLPGFNTLAVDWPQVGFSVDGSETYVAWLRFSDAEVDPTANMGLPGIVTGVGFGDIAASVAVGAGAWSAQQNLTQTPGTDERFFSLATRNANGVAHVLFQASATNQAGVAVIGDRGTSPGNLLRRIAYLERPLVATTVDVAGPAAPVIGRLRAWPNPARGRVAFALSGARVGTVSIYSLSGRLVAIVGLSPGGAAEWDGRDRTQRPAPSGVYLARLDGAGREAVTRFMLLH
jgi:hypothetical protein